MSKRVVTCQQCFEDYTVGSHDDGFCSDYCLEAYEKSFDDEEDDEESEEEE